MAMLEGAVNPTINGGTFIAVSNAPEILKSNPSNDIVDTLHSRSATAGLLDAAERFDAPKCDEGTRVTMLQGIKNFVQEGGPSSSSAIYWLHGPAGVGKSALAQSLALSLEAEGNRTASFFFSRTSPGRNDGNQLIVTLAYQLAVNFPALQPYISKTVKKNPAVLTASNMVKMQSLIVDPVNGWLKTYKRSVWWWAYKIFNTDRKLYPRLILVDGLDECSDPDVQRDLILCIGLAVRQLLLPFRFVITSRLESHILATFELDPIFQGLDRVKVATKNLGDDEDADEQITTFLLKEFAEIRRTHPIREFLPHKWPIPGQIAQLVSKSSKGFIYPATFIRYIKMPQNRPDECLERILGSSEIPIQDKPYEPLDMLYRYIFESVADVNKEAIRNIFHFLVVPNSLDSFITPLLIEEHFDFKPGHVQHVLHDLLCIVTFTGQAIKVLHASLPDFLLDQSRSGSLCINIGDAHATIAATFPLAIRSISMLPDFTSVEFLKHIMQANISNTLHHRLVDVDFNSRCMMPQRQHDNSFLPMDDFDRITFVAAYFLVLTITNAQQTDIRRHIIQIKAHILQISSFAASLHAVRHKLVPTMTPLFREWALSMIVHPYINYIFAFEVPPSQCELRQEIFELYLFMALPFYYLTPGDENYSQNIDLRLERHTQPLTNCLNHISQTLAEFLVNPCCWGLLTDSLKLLAADLLGVSLAYAGHSTRLLTLLKTLLDARRSPNMNECLPKLARSVIDYSDRIYLDATAQSHWQQKIVELNNAWRQYLLWYTLLAVGYSPYK